jgi:Right handed beta helix region
MRRVVTSLAVLTLLLGASAAAVAQSGSIGIVDTASGEWYLRDPANGATTRFFYGNPGDVPMVGDWDGDGDETPGLYRQSDGFVYLRNSNSQGVADIRFFFGNPGDIPLAGDFDGDGRDTVSIYRPSEGRVFIINALGANDGGLGAADFSYFFGNPGDKPYVGDFDQDGIDEVGLHRESTGFVYFRLTHTEGIADRQFIFGDPGDKMVAAEWAGRGAHGPETVGLFRSSNCTSHLRYTNTQGVADETLIYGVPSGLPVAGEFGVLPGGGEPPPGCSLPTPSPSLPPPAEYPNATNTGVPPGTALAASGSLVINTPGTVIDARDISGTLFINANNVTVTRTRVRSADWWVIKVEAGRTGVVIEDCEVDGLTGPEGQFGIVGPATVRRCDIHHTSDGIVPFSGSLIEANYIHDLAGTGNPHYDGIQFDGGNSNIVIRGNTVINDYGQTSAVMINNYFGPIRNVSVEDNRLIGGGYTVYSDGMFSGGPITGVSFTDNRMGEGQWGYALIRNNTITESGNIDDNTGAPITLDH